MQQGLEHCDALLVGLNPQDPVHPLFLTRPMPAFQVELFCCGRVVGSIH